MRQINLLPEALKKEHTQKPIFISVVLAAVIILVILGPTFLFLNIKLTNLQAELTRLEERKVKPAGKSPHDESKLRELVTERRMVFENNAFFHSLLVRRTDFSNVLNSLAGIVNGDIWLDEVGLNNQSESVKITGFTGDTARVSEFIFELKKIPFFSACELTSMDEVMIDKSKKIKFGISGILKK